MKRFAQLLALLFVGCGAPAMSGSHVESSAPQAVQSVQDACDEASDAQLAAWEEGGQAQNPSDCTLTVESYAAGYSRQLIERERALADASACEPICELVASVCGLSERICELADKTKAPSIVARCSDGQTRCAAAQRRAAEHCEC